MTTGTTASKRLSLPEAVTESTSFEILFGPIKGGEVRIDCSKLARINSAGIRRWFNFFKALSESNIKIIFEDVPAVLLESFASFSGMAPKGSEITSVILPYVCRRCQKSHDKKLTAEAIRKDPAAAEQSPCPHCNSTADFDNIPEVCFKPLLK